MSEASTGPWELWRQDDNGNRFVIGRFDTAEAAATEQRRFEALGHKQTYWVQPAPSEGGDRGASLGYDTRGCSPAQFAGLPAVVAADYARCGSDPVAVRPLSE